MKAWFFTSVLLFVSCFTYASRNLVLEPIFSSHELETGVKLEIRTTDQRDRLTSIELHIGENVISVPQEDLDVAKNPVISALLISGGIIGSEDIQTPRYITMGFGAHHCELSACPNKITYIFANGKYQEYFIEGSGNN